MRPTPPAGLLALVLIGLASAAAGGHQAIERPDPQPRVSPHAPIYYEAETNDSPASATPLPAGGQRLVIGMGAILSAGDEDYWTFVACENCDVSILVDTGGLSYGNSRDSIVELYASDGITLIEADDDGGLGTGGDLTMETPLSSLVAGRRLQAGRHYIKVKAKLPDRLIIPYRLVVTLANRYVPEVEPNGTAGTAQLLSHAATGVVGLMSSAADVDYYELQRLTGVTSYCAFVSGDHLQTGSSTSLTVSVRDISDNVLLASNAGELTGRTGTAVCFLAETDVSIYRFRIESRSGGTGFYSIYVVPGRSASPSRIDFDRSFTTDMAVWRPGTGNWHVLRAIHDWNPATELRIQWGAPGDIPVAADYDGDGFTDAAVFRPATGAWYVRRSTNPTSPLVLVWGQNGDLPRPRDFDGDGLADPCVWRPSTGQWFVLKSSTNYATTMTAAWGMAGDVPVPGEHDGDRRADFAVWRPSTGAWLRLASGRGHAPMPATAFGQAGDIPVPISFGAPYNRPAVFRPSNGFWYGPFRPWGTTGDIPVPGHYTDESLGEDLAVWRPSTGVWYVEHVTARTWGMAGDVPIADTY